MSDHEITVLSGQLDLAAFNLRLAVSILSDPLDGNIGGLPEIRFFSSGDVRTHVRNISSVPASPPL